MATQTVQELIDGFPHKPDKYAITTNPSRDEVKHVRKCIQANLAPSRIPCFQPETLDQGWKFLAQRQDEWEDAHHRRKKRIPRSTRRSKRNPADHVHSTHNVSANADLQQPHAPRH